MLILKILFVPFRLYLMFILLNVIVLPVISSLAIVYIKGFFIPGIQISGVYLNFTVSFVDALLSIFLALSLSVTLETMWKFSGVYDMLKIKDLPITNILKKILGVE